MQQTLFHGNDDGFTFLGTVILILVFLLILPAFARKTEAEYRDVSRQYSEVVNEVY